MLRSIKQLYGDKLKAIDGEIGHIKDFIFDSQTWIVRYVVVNTASLLSKHVVLLSPAAFTNFNEDGLCREVNLYRQQIEDSPPYDPQKPISLEEEAAHHSHYGMSFYWLGRGFAGRAGSPVADQALETCSNAAIIEIPASITSTNSRLMRTHSLMDFRIHALDGEAGRIRDFIVAGENWGISHVVVECGHWYASREIAISPRDISRISVEESSVFVDLTKEAILNSPHYYVPPWAF